MRAGRKAVEIRTAGGTVRADKVVLATGYPTADFRALHRHFAPVHTYVVLTDPMPAAMRREVGRRAAALRDTAQPPHVLRWMREDRIMYAGADQPAVAGPRAREDARAARRPADVRALDALPGHLGPHARLGVGRRVRGHARRPALLRARTATTRATSSRSATATTAPASRTSPRASSLRHHLGAPEKGDELFAFSRMG